MSPLRKNLPNIIDGPFYKGVVALADNSVILRIVALCTEANRGQMDRRPQPEIKLICDKYDINIPFRRSSSTSPTVIKQASERGRMRRRRRASSPRNSATRHCLPTS